MLIVQTEDLMATLDMGWDFAALNLLQIVTLEFLFLCIKPGANKHGAYKFLIEHNCIR